MQFSYENIQRPVYLPTGYDNIDLGLTEAPATSNWLSFKPAPDPIFVRLDGTLADSMALAGIWLTAETDFWAIANAHAVDSYFSTAVDKYMRLIAKEGWIIKGSDPNAVSYIKQRLAIFKVSTDHSFQSILDDIEYNLVLFGNAYLIKVPFQGKNPIPSLKLQVAKGAKPIGGLFTVHPARLKPVLDSKGNVDHWSFMVVGAEWAQFKPADVIQIVVNCPSDYTFGQPYFIPVLEDIRTYRQLEYLTTMLINRYLHPMVHVRKGIDSTGKHIYKVTDYDIQKTSAMIQSASPDGIFVTGPDITIDVKGVESQALRVGEYLDNWRKRIFAGLCVSDLTMGETKSGVNDTGKAIGAEMNDTALMFQNTIAESINSEVIFYWLIEGGFDPISVPDCAYFQYNSVAIDEDIKKRNQCLQEWFSGLITHAEYRQLMGMEPLGDNDILQNTYLGLTARIADIYQVMPGQNPTQGVTDNRQRAPQAKGTGRSGGAGTMPSAMPTGPGASGGSKFPSATPTTPPTVGGRSTKSPTPATNVMPHNTGSRGTKK